MQEENRVKVMRLKQQRVEGKSQKGQTVKNQQTFSLNSKII